MVLGIVLYSGIAYGQAPNASAIEIGNFQSYSRPHKMNDNSVQLPYTLKSQLFNFTGVLLSPKFLLTNYDNAQDLIEKVVQEMDRDVLIDGNTKVIFYGAENLRISKG